MRLNPNCETYDEVILYYRERTVQLYLDGYELSKIEPISNIGVLATFLKNGREYHSFYIYASKRGKGIYKKIYDQNKWNILTSRDCNMEKYLRKYEIKYTLALGFLDTHQYKMIESYYGNDCADRTGVPLMNHIDEGLAILNWLGSSLSAKKAYCLHPLYQDNKLLKKYAKDDMRSMNIFGMDADVIVNVMEYRSIANDYLSDKKILSIGDIKLSPLYEVNDMLIADKIQNRKDFEFYHMGKHPRSKELEQYFTNWMVRLDITDEMYRDYVNKLNVDVIKNKEEYV